IKSVILSAVRWSKATEHKSKPGSPAIPILDCWGGKDPKEDGIRHAASGFLTRDLAESDVCAWCAALHCRILITTHECTETFQQRISLIHCKFFANQNFHLPLRAKLWHFRIRRGNRPMKRITHLDLQRLFVPGSRR